jgi:hypothetical protein
VDDTTKKVMGFADYGEWWDEPGNALFTRRPSMINYDPAQSDSVFLAADTLWLYTIAVLPPAEARDTTSNDEEFQLEASAEEREHSDKVEAPSDMADTTQLAERAKDALVTEARLYENIVDEEKGKLNEDGSLNLNPNSLKVMECYLEESLQSAKKMDKFQFVRQGYFCVDEKDTTDDHLVFNRIVSLKSSFKLPQQ